MLAIPPFGQGTSGQVVELCRQWLDEETFP
jgi:hypothetical protein